MEICAVTGQISGEAQCEARPTQQFFAIKYVTKSARKQNHKCIKYSSIITHQKRIILWCEIRDGIPDAVMLVVGFTIFCTLIAKHESNC